MPVQESFWDYFSFAKFFLQVAGILPIGGTHTMWKSILTECLAASPLLYGLYLLVPQINSMVFRAAGILPISGTPSMWKSILTECFTALPLLYGFYYVIPEINYILFRSHATDNLLESMIIVNNVLGGQIRSIFVAINRRKITRLFAICATLWDHAILADYKVILIWARWARLFSTVYFCAAVFSITTFVFAATVKQLSSPANSTIRYYPFQVQEDSTPSPQYEIKYSLQVIIAYLGNSFIAAADITGTLLALNMCGQLALIQSWLLDLSKEEWITTRGNIDRSQQEAQLKKCIRRHQVVMNFCTKLEDVVRYIYLAQILTGMYALAVSAVRLTQSFEYRWIGPLLLSTGGLLFSCWPANNLFFASTEIAQAVYNVPWYHFSLREKTAVAIMLMRSQRPAKLTAGKFVVLSLETFTSIMSSSISFCMVLNSFV